jgi:transposase
MQREKDRKKRQRLHALSLAASGQARHRRTIATVLGVHRHRVAAWVQAYAEGGLAQARSSRVAKPPVHRRMTDAAWTALHAQLTDAQGCAGYTQMRTWLAEH